MSSKHRGHRECRAPNAPAASRAKMKKHTSKSTTGSPVSHRHSLRDGFTACFVISPVIGLSCHRRLQDHRLAGLTSASRCQDHTTSPSAMRTLVSRTHRVHRIPRQRPFQCSNFLLWSRTPWKQASEKSRLSRANDKNSLDQPNFDQEPSVQASRRECIHPLPVCTDDRNS